MLLCTVSLATGAASVTVVGVRRDDAVDGAVNPIVATSPTNIVLDKIATQRRVRKAGFRRFRFTGWVVMVLLSNVYLKE